MDGQWHQWILSTLGRIEPPQRNLLATMPTMNPALGHSDVYPNKLITEDQEGSTQGMYGLGHQ